MKKFQGQELEEELGKNTYAYQWRDYDPAIGRFGKVDRFADKYLAISPYAFTANNPISFIEVKGDSIGQGRHHYDRFRKNATDRRQKILDRRQKKLEKAEGNERKLAKLNKRYAAQDADPNSTISVLNQTISELDALEASDQVYNLVTNSPDVTSVDNGNITYDTATNEINVNVGGRYSDGLFAHELKHAFQFETGKLSFGRTGNGGLLYDLQDEVEAYSRGAFFGEQRRSFAEIQSKYRGISTRTTQLTLANKPSNASGSNPFGETYLQIFERTQAISRGTQFYKPPNPREN